MAKLASPASTFAQLAALTAHARNEPRCQFGMRLTVVVALGTHVAITGPALAGHLGYPVRGLDERYTEMTVRNCEWWDRATLVDVGTIPADHIAELSGGISGQRLVLCLITRSAHQLGISTLT